ncbi:hypothetical protein Tco_0333529, partial [Tanacetum coccineum]
FTPSVNFPLRYFGGVTDWYLEPSVANAIAAYEANQSNGNGIQNEASGSTGRVEHIARSCSYKEFLNCQPQDFDRIKGAVGLTRNEIQKMETELWNLTVKGNDVVSYTKRFQELALLCPTMVTMEYKKVGHYIWRLAYDIQGKVTSSRPTKIQEAVRKAHELADQLILSNDAKDADNKRKWEDDHKRKRVVQKHPYGLPKTVSRPSSILRPDFIHPLVN